MKKLSEDRITDSTLITEVPATVHFIFNGNKDNIVYILARGEMELTIAKLEFTGKLETLNSQLKDSVIQEKEVNSQKDKETIDQLTKKLKDKKEEIEEWQILKEKEIPNNLLTCDYFDKQCLTEIKRYINIGNNIRYSEEIEDIKHLFLSIQSGTLPIPYDKISASRIPFQLEKNRKQYATMQTFEIKRRTTTCNKP